MAVYITYKDKRPLRACERYLKRSGWVCQKVLDSVAYYDYLFKNAVSLVYGKNMVQVSWPNFKCEGNIREKDIPEFFKRL